MVDQRPRAKMSCKRNRGYRVRDAIRVTSMMFLWTRTRKVWYRSCSNKSNGAWDRNTTQTKTIITRAILACNRLCIYAAVCGWFDRYNRKEEAHRREGLELSTQDLTKLTHRKIMENIRRMKTEWILCFPHFDVFRILIFSVLSAFSWSSLSTSMFVSMWWNCRRRRRRCRRCTRGNRWLPQTHTRANACINTRVNKETRAHMYIQTHTHARTPTQTQTDPKTNISSVNHPSRVIRREKTNETNEKRESNVSAPHLHFKRRYRPLHSTLSA